MLPSRLVDIVQSVGMCNDGQALRHASIEEIARDHLRVHGVTMPMTVGSKDWAIQHLTVRRIKQLALEAYITYHYIMLNPPNM